MNPSTSMAGPCAGILLWGLVSGDTLALDSGLELAENLHWKTSHSNYSTGPNYQSDPRIGRIARETGLQVSPDGSSYGYEPVFASRTAGNVVGAMLMAYLATGEAEYLGLVERHSAFLERYETEIGSPDETDRFHFETTYIRNLGQYLLFRRDLGQMDDAMAIRILTRRIGLMTGPLWDPATNRFWMTYDGNRTSVDDNWCLSVADAFAVGSIVLGRSDLLTTYGRAVFEFGSRNQFYVGSALSYHSTKEFVNQVGFGNMFLYAWNRAQAPAGTNPPAPNAPPPSGGSGSSGGGTSSGSGSGTSTGTASSRRAVVRAIADTTLFSEVDSNTGAMENLFALRSHQTGSRILLRFPRVELPAGARATEVFLDLYVVGFDNVTDRARLAVSPVRRHWDEGDGLHEWDTAPATPGATWSGLRPGDLWASGDLGTRLARSRLPTREGRWSRIRLPLSSLGEANGFAVEGSASEWWRADFASSENPDARIRPRLVVKFER